MNLRSLKVALAHDWLTGMRGGEKVLEVLAEMFPNAPIHTLMYNPGSVSPTLEAHPIHPSALQKLPYARRAYRYYLPLLPRLIERARIEPVDLVISTSSAVAKGIVPPPGALHCSYVHSPMRYIYDRHDDYFGHGRSGWAARLGMRVFRRRLQRWDIASTSRVDHLAANSSFVAWRIWNLYRRTATVIHPPVETALFRAATRAPEDYYLMVSALVPYKNVDVAIEAFRLLDRKLLVAGAGPWFGRLKANLPANVELLGWVEQARLPELVAGCRAFLLPNVEDFGIAPVEAMAAGRPVIALAEGGVRDSVRDLDRYGAGELRGPWGPTGVFYHDNRPVELAKAVLRFEADESLFATEDLHAWSEQFSRDRFVQRIAQWLQAAWHAAATSKPLVPDTRMAA